MKKLAFLLLSALIFNCSSDGDSNDTNPTGETLELTHYTLNFPSGNISQHNFDGTKAKNSYKNSIITSEYKYNSNNKISEYIKYYESGNIEESYEFNYDNSGKLTSIDESYSGFFLPSNYTRTLTYEGNSIKTTYPQDNTSIYNQEFIFDENGLLKEYIKLDEDKKLVTKLIFEYDSNSNCTKLTLTDTNPFSGSLFTLIYKYTYSNNPNPYYPIYNKYYLEQILINTRKVFSYTIFEIIETFGKNICTEVIYPDAIPQLSRFNFQFTYNSAGYPTKQITKNNSTGQTTVETKFFYK